MIGLLVSLVGVKLFEWLLYDYIMLCGELGKNILFVFVCMLLSVWSSIQFISKYFSDSTKQIHKKEV